LGSRRKVEELIKAGLISVNGKVEKNLSRDIKPDDDKVLYKGKIITPERQVYYLVYKPRGYSSTVSFRTAQKPVIDLVPRGERIFPVGRLDVDSEGLMILTNDGAFANKLLHPKFKHEKEYLVQVRLPQKNTTEILNHAIRLFKCGVVLDGYHTVPAQAMVVSQSQGQATFRIVLKEGRKRQIRRTMEKAGLKVLNLRRVRIDKWQLGKLKPGEYKRFNW
jgi:23S rRNA pseudouridine2605 synthase